MSAAAPRLAKSTLDQRRLAVALGTLIVAVALLVAVAMSQQGTRSSVTPAISTTHALVVLGTNGGGIEYTGIPYPAPAPRDAHRLVVSGTNGGGIEYTGIPYPAAK